jgi:hypothetical protein
MVIYPIVVYSLPRDVFTGPLPSNGCPSIVRCALVGMCLPSNGVSSLHSVTLRANPSQYYNDISIKNDRPAFRSFSYSVKEVHRTELSNTDKEKETFGSATFRNSGKCFFTCYSISLSIFLPLSV